MVVTVLTFLVAESYYFHGECLWSGVCISKLKTNKVIFLILYLNSGRTVLCFCSLKNKNYLKVAFSVFQG